MQYNKMEEIRSKPVKNLLSKPENNVENKNRELIPISHKDFNEFIKGKGFKGRNNYKLKELKGMFGFKPLTKKNQVTVTIDDGKEFVTYGSMLRASLAAGIPYPTLQQVKRKSKSSINPVTIKSGRNIYVIKFNSI